MLLLKILVGLSILTTSSLYGKESSWQTSQVQGTLQVMHAWGNTSSVKVNELELKSSNSFQQIALSYSHEQPIIDGRTRDGYFAPTKDYKLVKSLKVENIDLDSKQKVQKFYTHKEKLSLPAASEDLEDLEIEGNTQVVLLLDHDQLTPISLRLEETDTVDPEQLSRAKEGYANLQNKLSKIKAQIQDMSNEEVENLYKESGEEMKMLIGAALDPMQVLASVIARIQLDLSSYSPEGIKLLSELTADFLD